MRLFVAVSPAPAVRAAAWSAAAPLRGAFPAAVAWVRAEALHVTLRFLGGRSPAFADALADGVAPLVADLPPPRIRLDAVGAFPSLRRPRVIWVGGPANSGATLLYHVVGRACDRLGVAPEEREFRPHVTLGRVRRGAAVDPARLARVAGTVRPGAGFVAATVDVVESVLTPAGARHRVLAAIPIGTRG